MNTAEEQLQLLSDTRNELEDWKRRCLGTSEVVDLQIKEIEALRHLTLTMSQLFKPDEYSSRTIALATQRVAQAEDDVRLLIEDLSDVEGKQTDHWRNKENGAGSK